MKRHQKIRDKRTTFDSIGSMEVVCALLNYRGTYLLGQRHNNHKWEFPGGKFQAFDESFKHALARELKEELCLHLDASAFEELGQQSFANGCLHFFTYTFHEPPIFLPQVHRAVAWCRLHEAKKLDLCDGDRAWLDQQGHLTP